MTPCPIHRTSLLLSDGWDSTILTIIPCFGELAFLFLPRRALFAVSKHQPAVFRSPQRGARMRRAHFRPPPRSALPARAPRPLHVLQTTRPAARRCEHVCASAALRIAAGTRPRDKAHAPAQRTPIGSRRAVHPARHAEQNVAAAPGRRRLPPFRDDPSAARQQQPRQETRRASGSLAPACAAHARSSCQSPSRSCAPIDREHRLPSPQKARAAPIARPRCAPENIVRSNAPPPRLQTADSPPSA